LPYGICFRFFRLESITYADSHRHFLDLAFKLKSGIKPEERGDQSLALIPWFETAKLFQIQ